MTPQQTAAALDRTLSTPAAIGAPLGWLIVAAGLALAAVSLAPGLDRFRRPALLATAGLLGAGELLLAWLHWRLYALAALVDPATGVRTGNVAVPLWVESEKLYVWALVLAAMMLLARRHAEELSRPVGAILGGLAVAAVLVGKPFTEPLPDFVEQLRTYLIASASGIPQAAYGAFQGMEAARANYYNSWYMWVHPPLLFVSYGAFVLSFVAAMLMVVKRHSGYETTSYWWARLGYLPLTVGMLLGVPWALFAWQGDAWWWSGKVNMSIMMWLLYTAYLHARLYLRRRGMWRWVAALAALSFLALVLTYLTTYLVPGAHSVA